MHFWNVILLAASLGVLLPMAVWTLECAAALLAPRARDLLPDWVRPRVAVLIPAHNEAEGLRKTLDHLAPQVLPRDRVIVIADNCTDETATIARQCGVSVVERRDTERRGKSYALDIGVRSLAADPPEVVVVIDADCKVHPGAIDRMARLAFATGRPIQANDALEISRDRTPQRNIAALAFLIKNFVRPRGLDRLGLPCFLNGCGMAFPWPVIRGAALATGKIAEDLWLTADLALAGHLPMFCREAKVTSSPPRKKLAERTQRTRWLHGHLECMLGQGPRLLLEAVRQRRFDLFALAMDIWVPPLSLLMFAWAVVLAIALTAAVLGGGWVPVILVAAGGACMAACLCAVLLKFGDRQALSTVLGAPYYVVAKLPVYVAFASRRQKEWVRTERDPL